MKTSSRFILPFRAAASAALALGFGLLSEGARSEVALWEPHELAFSTPAKVANPFLVRFGATVRGPDGREHELPGFFDGAGVWKLRVMAHRPGEWSLVTRSDLPDLDGRRATFHCEARPKPGRHGRLRVDPKHPHHFVFEDGTRYYLLGYECDWLWALDAGRPDLPVLRPFLDKLASSGFNHVILNSYAYDTRWREGRTGDDDFGPPPLHAWEGTNREPDHSRFQLAYWQHYDRVIQALLDRGMTAHILLKVYNKRVRWPVRGSAEDDLFFRWMVARYAAFPNVIWDFSKEAHNEKNLDYKLSRLRLLRGMDPYGHLVTNHDDDVNNDRGVFDGLTDFRTDQQHSKLRETILAQRLRRAWPVANVEFGYEQGPGGPEDKTYGSTHTPEELVLRAWEVAMAGGYAAYYYTYTAWDVIRPADTPAGYEHFRRLREFFERTRYWELAPVDPIAENAWTLALPGREYVVFLREAGPVEFAAAHAPPPLMNGEWFDPLTGRRMEAGPIRQGKRLRPPGGWRGPILLHAVAAAAD